MLDLGHYWLCSFNSERSGPKVLQTRRTGDGRPVLRPPGASGALPRVISLADRTRLQDRGSVSQPSSPRSMVYPPEFMVNCVTVPFQQHRIMPMTSRRVPPPRLEGPWEHWAEVELAARGSWSGSHAKVLAAAQRKLQGRSMRDFEQSKAQGWETPEDLLARWISLHRLDFEVIGDKPPLASVPRIEWANKSQSAWKRGNHGLPQKTDYLCEIQAFFGKEDQAEGTGIHQRS